MAVEYELKFQTTPEVLSAICQSIPEASTRYEMETVYYDTPTGQLSARHYTLRCRRENDIHVCTLKTPAKEGRNETELPCENILDALDALCEQSGIEGLKDILKDVQR